MEDSTIYSIALVVVGLLVLIIGLLTNRLKLGYIVRGVNLNKYDKNIVSEIAGSHLLIYGLILVVLGVLNYILEGAYLRLIVLVSIFCGIATEYGGYRKITKYAKIK